MASALDKVSLVAVGASAGGVEAVAGLLRVLPKDFPATIVIVVHVPQDRPSLLPQVLSRSCLLPVREAEDKEPLLPATVYVAPPGYHLLLESQPLQLSLSVDDPVNFSRPSIDVLFESCADALGPCVLGIILSGASDDGAAGLRAVKAHGGWAAVQSPGEAKVPTMPAAALAACRVDFILRVDEFAGVFRQVHGRATPRAGRERAHP